MRRFSGYETTVSMTWRIPLLFCACLGAEAQSRNASVEIRPVIEQMHRAWESLDMEKVRPLYAADAGALYFDVGTLKSTGLRAYLADFQPAAADWKSLKLKLIPDFQAWRQGTLAFAAFTYAFEITTKSGEAMRATARSTTVLEQRGGRWLIVHEHSSAPWGGQ